MLKSLLLAGLLSSFAVVGSPTIDARSSDRVDGLPAIAVRCEHDVRSTVEDTAIGVWLAAPGSEGCTPPEVRCALTNCGCGGVTGHACCDATCVYTCKEPPCCPPPGPEGDE